MAYITLPKLNRSARLSTGSPRACSGAMYAGVPFTCPASDAAASTVSARPVPAPRSSGTT